MGVGGWGGREGKRRSPALKCVHSMIVGMRKTETVANWW